MDDIILRNIEIKKLANPSIKCKYPLAQVSGYVSGPYVDREFKFMIALDIPINVFKKALCDAIGDVENDLIEKNNNEKHNQN
jgi:hypothetical protein